MWSILTTVTMLPVPLLKSCSSSSTPKRLTIPSKRALKTRRRIKCGFHSGAWKLSTSATRTGRHASKGSPLAPSKRLPTETRTSQTLAPHGKRHCGTKFTIKLNPSLLICQLRVEIEILNTMITNELSIRRTKWSGSNLMKKRTFQVGPESWTIVITMHNKVNTLTKPIVPLIQRSTKSHADRVANREFWIGFIDLEKEVR